MKRLLAVAVATLCTLLAGTGVAFAQNDGVPQFRPVEMWVCNYNERKDQGDFDSVLEDLVAVIGDDPYAAYRLTPNFVTDEQDFDFIYLGVWESGASMGRDMAKYMANGTAVDAAWNETVDCPASLMYASSEIQPVGSGDADGGGDFMLTVSDCTVGHGQSNGQALGALRRFNDYRVTNGSEVPTFAWFPVYGGGGIEFSFKLVQAYAGAEHFGNSFQWFVDHQAYLVQEDIMSGVLDCDVPRVYIGETIMNNLNQD